MQKITCLFICLIMSLLGRAQDSCETAIEVIEGVPTTISTIDGEFNNSCNWSEVSDAGEWYKYTTTVEGIITITSDLPENDPILNDTKLSVFTGNCGDLSCVTADDDSGTELLSSVSFAVSPGTTYFILWDDFYTSIGFDFLVEETEVECPDGTLPFSNDFSNVGEFYVCWDQIDNDGDGFGWYVVDYDLDDDGSLDDNPTLASNSWDNIPLTPDNWAITYAIDLGDLTSMDDILLRWSARGIDPDFAEENYTVYVSTGNEISDFLGSSLSFNETLSESIGGGEFVDRSLDISELAGNTIYIAFRHHDVSDQFVLNIDNVSIDVTLSTDDLRANNISYSYDSERDELLLKSSQGSFSSIELRNTLGQNVLSSRLKNSNELINLKNLEDGIYFARIQREDIIVNLNFLKH